MKKTFYLALLWSAFFVGAFAQANIKLTETTLMHEMRATPYPKDKAVVDDRYVSFQWPLRADANVTSEVLDGMERKTKVDKSKLKYRLRYSQDASFAKGTKERYTIDFRYVVLAIRLCQRSRTSGVEKHARTDRRR